MKSTEEDDDVVGRERVGLKKKTEMVEVFMTRIFLVVLEYLVSLSLHLSLRLMSRDAHLRSVALFQMSKVM